MALHYHDHKRCPALLSNSFILLIQLSTRTSSKSFSIRNSLRVYSWKGLRSSYSGRQFLMVGLWKSLRAIRWLKSSGMGCFLRQSSSLDNTSMTPSMDWCSFMRESALTGPIMGILAVQSHPQRMQKSMNCSCVSPRADRISLRESQVMLLPRLKFRSRNGAPKTSVSTSSPITPQTYLFLASQAHWASPSAAACMTGSPIRVSSFLASYLSVCEMQILRLLCRTASQISPASLAAQVLESASYLSCLRRYSSSNLCCGARPSNTHTVSSCASLQSRTRQSRPMRWPVWFPWASVGELTLLWEYVIVFARKEYIVLDASTAIT